MKHSLNVENTPTHHRRDYKALGATQPSIIAKFKATSRKIGQNRNLPHV